MLRTVIFRLVVIGCILSIWMCQALAQHPIAFPERSSATSPDGRYVLVNVDRDSEPFEHTIFLEDRKHKTRREIYRYERGVQVLWNPDGRQFALSDFAGSDYATCNIMSVNQEIKAIPVLENLLKMVSTKEKERIQRNDHLYIAGVRWIDGKRLLVKIWGHDSDTRTGFERYYRYKVP